MNAVNEGPASPTSTLPTRCSFHFLHRACYIHVHTAMNHLRNLAGLTVLLPLAFGCAARTAPFDQMDQAQITVLRLGQAPQAPMAGPTAPGAVPGLPGVPPEWQQMGQQILQGAQGVIPPGFIPPGLIPNQGQATPAQPPAPQFKGFTIVGPQAPVTDSSLRDEILDIFGNEGSFSANRQNCFTPGMGIVMTRPGAPEVDLLVSLACNQAMGDGFRWPYPVNGFTQEAHDRLAKVYEKLFGPVPPGA